MIDWHCHILPGLDDGSRNIEQSLSMAGLLAAHGFTEIHCTPHLIRGCFEASNTDVRQGIQELQQLIRDNNIPLTLLAGREYFLDEYLLTYLEEPLPLGDSCQILVEIPPRTTDDMVRQVLYKVVRAGFTPVIAHPERCHLLELKTEPAVGRGFFGSIKRALTGGRDNYQHPEPPDTTGNLLLDYLRDLGCHFQGNMGSFSGFYGWQVKAISDTMKLKGIYDRFGSDLHAPEHADRILQSIKSS
ncbi:MAG: tyrosine-protein phosphatase [Desulfuromonadaceae bacterium]